LQQYDAHSSCCKNKSRGHCLMLRAIALALRRPRLQQNPIHSVISVTDTRLHVLKEGNS
jgi:hypothetical protein